VAISSRAPLGRESYYPMPGNPGSRAAEVALARSSSGDSSRSLPPPSATEPSSAAEASLDMGHINHHIRWPPPGTNYQEDPWRHWGIDVRKVPRHEMGILRRVLEEQAATEPHPRTRYGLDIRERMMFMSPPSTTFAVPRPRPGPRREEMLGGQGEPRPASRARRPRVLRPGIPIRPGTPTSSRRSNAWNRSGWRPMRPGATSQTSTSSSMEQPPLEMGVGTLAPDNETSRSPERPTRWGMLSQNPPYAPSESYSGSSCTRSSPTSSERGGERGGTPQDSDE
jgi:hypothetical protein